MKNLKSYFISFKIYNFLIILYKITSISLHYFRLDLIPF
jgi:hypothetical protein